MGRFSLVHSHLYTFVDTAYLEGRDPEWICRELCEGGSDIIQLRAKNATKESIRILAGKLFAVTSRFNVPLVLNDHPDIAAELGIPLCHMGQEDFFDQGYTHVRDLGTSELRPGIGLSTHAPAQATRSIQADPAYIAIGPVFPTPTKPTASPVTLDYVRWAKENVALPWFAIGGINQETFRQVLDAGAERVCIVSAILKSKNVRDTCRWFKDAIVLHLRDTPADQV